MRIALMLIGTMINTNGGVEKVCCEMANAMASRGHDVSIVSFEKAEGRPFFSLDERVNYMNLGVGVKINRLTVNVKNLFVADKNKREWNRLQHDCAVIADKLKPILEKLNPDVFITYEKSSDIVLKDILKVNIPVIKMFHFNPEEILNNPYLFPTYASMDYVQVLMPSDVEKTKRILGIENVIYIPNIVPEYTEKSTCEGHLIINVARVEPKQKRQHLLLEAFNKIKNKYPDWKVEIWGSTNVNKKYFRELVSYVHDNKLQDRINFCGVTNNVVKQLKRASIFAFPSAYEGFSLAMTEAMSMGLPVVALKNCPAVNELVVDGKNGYLVEDNVDEYAKALSKLMASIELREQLGAQAKKDMLNYAPTKVWDMWENLINDVVRR